MASSNASNYFPARNLRKEIQQDGAWLVAYKADQRSHLQGLICSKKTAEVIDGKAVTVKKSEPLKPITKNVVQTSAVSFQLPARKKVVESELDGFFLLKHCAVEDPSDLCNANIESCGLCETKVEDLPMFDNVVIVKASDNMLAFEAMSHFPKLTELTMALNALRDLQVQETDFPFLETLDVSFNNLSPNDIKTLGLLRNLRVLTASGNNLHSLPPLSNQPDPEEQQLQEVQDVADEQDPLAAILARAKSYREPPELFPKLEVLNLDDNRFSDERVFLALATLRRLRVLNLQKNELRSVPYLQVVNGRAQVDRNIKKRKRRQQKAQTAEAQAQAQAQTQAAVPQAAVQNFGLDTLDQTEDSEQQAAARTIAALQQPPTLEPPFCELHSLNLAENPIVRDADLLPLVGWPALQHIDLHGTPLVGSTAGDPPIVRRIFKERLGMQVVRKQAERAQKPRVEIRRDKPERLHIKMEVIPIPKCDVEKLLAANSSLMHAPDSPAVQGRNPAPAAAPELPTPSDPHAEPFFVTQVDEKQSPAKVQAPAKVAQSAVSKTSKNNSSRSVKLFDDGGWKNDEELQREPSAFAIDDIRFRGYEDLLKGIPQDKEMDSTMPKDMNGMVAALRYSLHHPLLLDTDTRLDKLVRPYNIAKKVLPTTKQTAAQMREQRIEKAYATLRKNQTIQSVPLVDVLKPEAEKRDVKISARDRKQARRMFDQLGKQYEKVREQSLQHAFESLEKVAADIDSMRDTIQKNVLRMTEERSEDRKREIEQLEAKLTRLESPGASSTSAVGLFMQKKPHPHSHSHVLRNDS